MDAGDTLSKRTRFFTDPPYDVRHSDRVVRSEVRARLKKELMNVPHRKNVERCEGDASSRLLLLSPAVKDPETLQGDDLRPRLALSCEGRAALAAARTEAALNEYRQMVLIVQFIGLEIMSRVVS